MKKVIHNKLHVTKQQNKKPVTANKTNFKIYRIVWRDAYTEQDEWHDETTVTGQDYLCETTGYLVANKANYYTIASTLTQDSYYCSLINIPKHMVVTKKRLYTN